MTPSNHQLRFEDPGYFKGHLFVQYLTACTNQYGSNNRTGKRRAHCQQRRANLKRFKFSVTKCKLYNWKKGIETVCVGHWCAVNASCI